MDTPATPVAALPVAAEATGVLSYDTPYLPEDLDPTKWVPALASMVYVAVGSGLCVGTCWLFLMSQSEWSVALHMAVYGLTLFFAMRGGRLLPTDDGPVDRRRTSMDVLAGAGLVIIGLTPAVGLATHNGLYARHLVGPLTPVLGLAFALLTGTTYRHLLLYRKLARPMRAAGRRGLANTLIAMGAIKMVYEAVWLFCCAVPLIGFAIVQHLPNGQQEHLAGPAMLLAFGALFGCIGFVGIWIWMIVMHAVALGVAKRPRAIGFEVEFRQAAEATPVA